MYKIAHSPTSHPEKAPEHYLGKTLQEKTKNLVQVSSALKEIAQTHGTDIICSGNTILAGLSAIMNSGNIFSFALNAGLALAGGKRLYNILQANKSSSTQSELGELLRNAQAGIGILQIHSKMNSGTLNELEKTLLSVEARTQQVGGSISELKSISLRGRTDLETNRNTAFKLYEEANQLYADSRYVLKGCEAKMERSSNLFESALKKFDQIRELVQSEEGTFISRVEQLESLTLEISKECDEASKLMDEARADLDSGIAKSDAASLIMSKAAFEFGRLKEGAGEEFAKLEALANELVQKNEHSQKEIARMKELVEEITACYEDSKKVLIEMENDNKKAQQISTGHSTGAFIAGGLLAGATAGFGILPCIAGTLLAAHAYDQKDRVAAKIGDWAFSIPCEDDPNTIPVGKYKVVLVFDKASSGSFNRYIKQEKSHTTGTLRINLGKETANLRFDFRRQDVIKKLDLCELQHLMSQLLISNPEAAVHVAKILHTLENIEIDRGPQGKVKGLIPSDSPYFRGIKRLCSNTITSNELIEEQPIAVQPAIVEKTPEIEAPKVLSETHHFSHLTAIGEKACQASKAAVAVAIVLSKASTMTYKHGTDTLTSGTTLVNGLSLLGTSVVSGGTIPLLIGAGLTLAGATRLYSIIKDIKNPQSEETFAELLENNEAGISMLQTIGESQSEILYQMDKTLDSVENLSKEVAISLKEIKELAIEGNKELEERRNAGLALYKQAEQSFGEARDCYGKSQEKMDASSALYKSAISKFKQLSALAKSTQGDYKERTDQFLKLSIEIDRECGQAKGLMEEAQSLLAQGIQLSDSATEVMQKAAFEFGRLKERASQKFVKLETTAADLAKKNEQSLQKMETMKGHIQEMKENIEASNQIIEDLEKDNRKAQQMSQGYSTGSLVAGGIFAGLVTMSVGLLPGIAAAFAAATVYEKKDIIARKICDWAFNIPAPNDPKKLPIDKYGVSLILDPNSTGFFKRYIKKETSKTAGTLRIELGDQLLSYNINLNKTNPFEKLDQQNLATLMYTKVGNNPALAPQFLSILEKIETLKVTRANGKEQEVVGKNSLSFTTLKRYCNVLIKEANQTEIAKKETPKAKTFLSYTFDPTPKGFFSRKTETGSLTLNLGREKVTYSFDMNGKQRLASKDLKHLCDKMRANLTKEPDLAPKYLEILKELQNKKITRDGKTIAQGFASPHYPFIDDVKKLCVKLTS